MFDMFTSKLNGAPMSNDQCSKEENEINIMKEKPYSSTIGSLMYTQVCSSPYIAGVLSRYLSVQTYALSCSQEGI